MINLRHIIFCLLIVVLSPQAAVGQSQGQPSGQSTSDPNADQLKALIGELTTQLDRAEKDRLADPWFLRDLRNLVGRYDWPWQKRLFTDDFQGGGPQPDPPWRVTAGEFLIDWRYGLRSVISQQSAQAQQQQQKPLKGDEAVKQLFGQILQQAITGESNSGNTANAPAAASYAAALAPIAISNAFAISMEITARPVDGVAAGRFEFGPYQGASASAGYRLAYTPGAPAGAATLELLSLSPRGTTSTIEVYDQPLALNDGQAHRIAWTRDRNGVMALSVDGAEIMRVTDRGFRSAFDGFAMVNSGGDYALRRITIDGVDG